MTTSIPVPAGGAAAWRALRDLRTADGGIAAHWPAVPSLLAALDAEYLGRAGALLARVDPGDVLARHPGVPDTKVTITGSSTLGGLAGAMAAEAARHGMLVRATVSGPGQWFTDLGEATAPGYAEPADLRLCVLDAHAVFDEVPCPWQVGDVERALETLLGRLTAVADAAEQATGGLCVLNTVPLTALHAHQLVDHRSRMRLGAAWREFNASLLRLGTARRSVVVVDLDVLATGQGPLEQPRLRAHARVHFSDGVLTAYAREVAHLARALTGRTRKCLVLDLDGTLWGGILGDDGPAGIRLGPDGGSTGEAFAAFGRVVRQLSAQGVLLAVCSKNDPGQVAAVLRGHPALPLRAEDFVAVAAGWEPKDTMIAAIARELDVGTDSLVFVDDSSFERGLVRAALPEVAVVDVDDEPALHADRLLADGWFTTVELTATDRERAADYHARAAREQARSGHTSLADYLAELAVHVDLRPAAQADAGRVAQLSQRTNQFNLTTRRMTPADVARLVAAAGQPEQAGYPEQTGQVPPGPERPVVIRYRDRFGDLGIVGAAFIRPEGAVWHIDNLLLSCRVFGRGVETACLAGLADAARRSGARALRGYYAPTAKNARFAGFYPQHGFAPAPGDQACPPAQGTPAARKKKDHATFGPVDAAPAPAAFDLDLCRPPPTDDTASAAITLTVDHPLADVKGGPSPC